MDVSSAVRAQMLDLADRLDELNGEEWNSRSLCDLWRVRDVLAHTVAGAEGAFRVRPVLLGVLRNGFRYNRWGALDGQERGQQEPALLVQALRNASEASTASRQPVRALAHVLIHGQDICRPLKIQRELPEEQLAAVADFVATSIIFRAKRRISGLRLIASDIEWSRGRGLRVTGPAEALVMVMAGRVDALRDLSGEGVAVLRRAYGG